MPDPHDDYLFTDPFPGRCKNYRFHRTRQGIGQWERCLDYSDVNHYCVFPRSKPFSAGRLTFGILKPKRWVKPGDDARDRVHSPDGE